MKTLPKRPELSFKYVDGEDRQMISMRLPVALLRQIENIASAKGWSKTEVFQFALDQFAQLESKDR